MVKCLCIVQARLTSTRLPNKILQLLGNSNKSILEHVFERLSASKQIDKIVFAIPDTSSNDALADFLSRKGFEFVRGDEENVLSRFMLAASKYKPEVIVRATCDNPFVDWKLADLKIEALKDNDYVKSEGAPLGTSEEVFRYSALEEAFAHAKEPSEFEHVTPYIYRHPEIFSIVTVPYYLQVKSKYRLTVDTVEDFRLVTTLYEHLYKGEPILNTEVYDFLDAHPEIMSINADVIQKTI